MAEINNTNDQLVGSYGSNGIVVTLPHPMTTRQEVYRHAAWLLACAEVLPDDPQQVDDAGDPYTFAQYLTAVRNA
jgi:hypothetical protein